MGFPAADLRAKTGEHIVPSDTDELDITRSGSCDSLQPIESTCNNDGSGSLKLPAMTFWLGPVTCPASFDAEMREDDDQYTLLLDEMLYCNEGAFDSCDKD